MKRMLVNVIRCMLLSLILFSYLGISTISMAEVESKNILVVYEETVNSKENVAEPFYPEENEKNLTNLASVPKEYSYLPKTGEKIQPILLLIGFLFLVLSMLWKATTIRKKVSDEQDIHK